MPSGRGLGVYHARREQPVLLPTAALYDRLVMEDEAEREARTPFLEWSLRIPEPKTGTLDFKRWRFQRAMYGEDVAQAKEVVVQKSTQVGISVWLIRSALYWPDMKGLTAIYLFPKKVQLGEFVQQRIRPVVRGGDYMPTRIPRSHIDNVFQKEIGLGYINFRGSDVIDDLDSIDADMLAFDEYDRLNQRNIEHAEHRVDASPLGLIRRIGNPTVDEYGVSKAYEGSDKRQWFVPCPACGLRQPLTFEDNVDHERVAIVCSRADCRKPLNVVEGEWVAEHPDREVIGFHVSRLMVPGVNLAKIIANSYKRDPEARKVFFNKDLGIPYVGSEDRLTLAHLRAAQTIMGEYEMPFAIDSPHPVTMGVDVASKRALNAVVSEWTDFENRRKRVLWVGEVTRWYNQDEGDGPSLEELMARYGVNMAVFDHEPEWNSVAAFMASFPGRVFAANYAANQKDTFAIDVDMGRVSVRRTERIDLTFHRIRNQDVGLPQGLPTGHGSGRISKNDKDVDSSGYVAQMRANVRVTEENDKGQRIPTYQKVGQFDDYAHAHVYDDVAGDVFAVISGVQELIGGEDEAEVPLDDMLEFHRSSVDDLDDMDYRAGPEEADPTSWGYS